MSRSNLLSPAAVSAFSPASSVMRLSRPVGRLMAMAALGAAAWLGAPAAHAADTPACEVSHPVRFGGMNWESNLVLTEIERRILAIPLLVCVYLGPFDAWGEHSRNLVATILFILASLTDWLDGWLLCPP